VLDRLGDRALSRVGIPDLCKSSKSMEAAAAEEADAVTWPLPIEVPVVATCRDDATLPSL
jgi:hypothetical protein